MIVKNSRTSKKVVQLASFCMDAQGRAYESAGVDYLAPGLIRADIVKSLVDDIARYIYVKGDNLQWHDYSKAADILTDNNAHLASKILLLMR